VSGVIKTAAEVLFAYKFVELLTTPFEEWAAFRVGLIDATGKVLRKPQNRIEKNMLSVWYNLVRNIKRTLILFPGGATKVASFAAAFMLLKEKKGQRINEVIRQMYPEWPEPNKMRTESSEFLKPGTYLVLENCPMHAGTVITIEATAFPIENLVPAVYRLPIDTTHDKRSAYACKSQLQRV
jgi:hypothetical protein